MCASTDARACPADVRTALCAGLYLKPAQVDTVVLREDKPAHGARQRDKWRPKLIRNTSNLSQSYALILSAYFLKV